METFFRTAHTKVSFQYLAIALCLSLFRAMGALNRATQNSSVQMTVDSNSAKPCASDVHNAITVMTCVLRIQNFSSFKVTNDPCLMLIFGGRERSVRHRVLFRWWSRSAAG